MSPKTEAALTAIVITLAILGLLAYGIAQIVWAVQCGNAGGAYIIPQNSFPVCVAGVK